MPPYLTRSKTAAGVPPAEVATASSRRRRVVLHLQPRKDPATEVGPPVSSTLAPAADPPVTPVVCSPLEPLFLGMDDDVVVPSPLPSPFLAPVVPDPMGNDVSPTSPAINLYEVDGRHSAVEVTTPEQQAAWEAELAWTPTPPPAADNVIDTVLASSQAATPVFRPEIQPLTTPPPSLGGVMGWSAQSGGGRSSYEGSAGIKGSGRIAGIAEVSEIGNSYDSLTDLTERCVNETNITNPSEISRKHDLVEDSAVISDKDIRTTIHMQESPHLYGKGTKLHRAGGPVLPRGGPSPTTCSGLQLRGTQGRNRGGPLVVKGSRAVQWTLVERT
ncbi:hypothetical protein NDA18_003911 [Ustilago nuda]|nr:hypothetical protein NDA18_003911 [Ustilago nuda]